MTCRHRSRPSRVPTAGYRPYAGAAPPHPPPTLPRPTTARTGPRWRRRRADRAGAHRPHATADHPPQPSTNRRGSFRATSHPTRPNGRSTPQSRHTRTRRPSASPREPPDRNPVRAASRSARPSAPTPAPTDPSWRRHPATRPPEREPADAAPRNAATARHRRHPTTPASRRDCTRRRTRSRAPTSRYPPPRPPTPATTRRPR